MANLKNITELPMAESAEGLNLIVNDNGAAKQIAASAVGKVRSINGIEPDASGNIEIEISGGSWNDLKDKPFYSDVETTVVLEEAIFTAEPDASAISFTPTINFEENITYKVIYNGNTYCLKPSYFSIAKAYLLGNRQLAVGGDDTGEPFCIMIGTGTNNATFGAIYLADYSDPVSIGIVIENEAIHTLDAKYLPELTPSWDNVKDRPFYEAVEKATYVEEITLNDFEYSDSYDWMQKNLWDYPLNINTKLEVGKSYIVVWNGVEYSVELQETEGGYYFGHNYYGYGWYADVPFGIWVTLNNTITMIETTDSGNSHTFEIYEMTEVVHKLDAKYLPADGRIFTVNFETTDGTNYHCEKTAAEIELIKQEGYFIIAKFNNLLLNYVSGDNTYAEFSVLNIVNLDDGTVVLRKTTITRDSLWYSTYSNKDYALSLIN